MLNLKQIIESVEDNCGRIENIETIVDDIEKREAVVNTKLDFITKNLESVCLKITNIEKIIIDNAVNDTRHNKDKLVLLISAAVSGAIALVIAILNKVF